MLLKQCPFIFCRREEGVAAVMKKHPILLCVVILVAVGLVLGLSATDVWNYVIELCSVVIHWFVAWLNEIIIALRDAFNEATATNTAII